MTVGWNRGGRYHGGFPDPVRRQAKVLPPGCAHCGATEGLRLDHIIPAAEGGPDTIDNAQRLCPPCHRAKTRAEAIRGRRRRDARGRIDPDPHPGLKGNPPGVSQGGGGMMPPEAEGRPAGVSRQGFVQVIGFLPRRGGAATDQPRRL